jgi:methionyl-tRNA synthetase
MNAPDPRPLLVTSALPYANGPLHFGHIAGAYLPADIFVRYHRLAGSDVVYVCGTDEHGVAITLNAEKEGRSYQEYVDHWHGEIKALFDRFQIEFDIFSRTSHREPHYPLSQEFFLRLLRAGLLVRRDVQQLWSEKTGRFLADRYVRGRCYVCGHEPARGDECPKCGSWLEATKLIAPVSALDPSDALVLKTAWQFELDMSPISEGNARAAEAFGPEFARYLDSMRARLKPNVRAMMFDKLIDGEKMHGRPISRDLPWGVPLPTNGLDGKSLGDVSGKVLYVWFDAPIGYISATIEWAQARAKRKARRPAAAGGGEATADDWRRYWICSPSNVFKPSKDAVDPQYLGPRLVHFIGKDNIPFHGIVFPAMLAGQGQAGPKETMPAGSLAPGRPLYGPRKGESWVLPHDVPANEFYNLEGRKFSTSERWTLDNARMFELFGADALRWYLCVSMPEIGDSQFTFHALQAAVNADLCDTLGNYCARVLKFAGTHLGGKVPPAPTRTDHGAAGLSGGTAESLRTTHARCELAVREVGAALAAREFRRAAGAVTDFGRWANKLFDEHAPWKTRKSDPAVCGRQIHEHIQVVATLSVLLSPFTPSAATRLRAMLALPEDGARWEAPVMPAGHVLGTPGILYAKIEDAVIAEERQKLQAAQAAH